MLISPWEPAGQLQGQLQQKQLALVWTIARGGRFFSRKSLLPFKSLPAGSYYFQNIFGALTGKSGFRGSYQNMFLLIQFQDLLKASNARKRDSYWKGALT